MSKRNKEKKLKKTDASRKNIRWERLDNTAHLFPSIARESMTNVYRVSVTLSEDIDREKLQQALDTLLPKMDSFNLRMRSGVFWNYFEENGKSAPRVVEEHTFPCQYIAQNKNHNYLFRVTYYKNKINLEVFHVLTDGMGAIHFLRELTYQYLRNVHSELKQENGDELSSDTSLNREDSFVKNYTSRKPSGFIRKKSYLMKAEKLPKGELGVMHAKMQIEQIKKAATSYGTSINEYFVAVFVWSVYKECLHMCPSKRPIRVAVPVNLRPYFNSVTTKNFFVMVSAEFFPTKESYTFEEVAECIRESLQKQINKEHLGDLFSYSVSNQTNVFLRPVPLFLKNIVMKAVYTKSALANTTTITNIGRIDVEEQYRNYIENFHAYITVSKGQSLKGTICSFNSELVFTFTGILEDVSVQRSFFCKLQEDGIDVKLETNGVYYE